MQTFKSLLQVTLTLTICILLASCGDGCYEDPDFSQAIPSIDKTKTFTIYPQKDEWTDTGIDIVGYQTNSGAKHYASAEIIVQGRVSLCKNNNSPRSLKYTTICHKNEPGFLEGYVVHMCISPSKTGDYTNCLNTTSCDAQRKNCVTNLVAMRKLTCSAEQENFVCDNGTLYKPTDSGSWETDGTSCAFDSLCSTCTPSVLFCIDNGTLGYFNMDDLDINDLAKTTIGIPGSTCTAPLKEYQITSTETKWTKITDAEGIKAGDIVTLSIMKPPDPAPTISTKIVELPIRSDDTSWNAYTPDVNRYSNWVASLAESKRNNTGCPQNIAYNTTIPGECGFNKDTGKSFNCESYAVDKTTNSTCLWMTFGTGLKLAADDTCNAPELLKASTISNKLIDFTDTSKSTYGKYVATVDPANSKNKLKGERTFVAEAPMKNLCAGIYDTNTNDNRGGYTMNAEVTSCVAVDGHPSPAVPSDPTLGALMYTFDKSVAPSQLFTDTKLYDPYNTDPTSSTQTVPNTTQNTRLYLKISVPSEWRDISTGEYTVTVNYKEYYMKVLISGIIDDITKFIKEIMFGDGRNPGSIQTYFDSLKGKENKVSYSQYITILLVLYILLYGASFLTGNTQISQHDLLIRVIKIGIVIALISDSSWNFFYNHFFQLFINGTDSLIRMFGISGCAVSPCPIFYFVDNSLMLLLATPSTLLKILALVFISPIGILIVILFLVAVFYFLLGTFAAIVAYLLCIMAIAILISLAPIFIPFALFDFTEYLFDRWWKLLVRYTLEPVLLIFGLQILVQIFYATLTQLIDFTVCWKCVWPINFNFSPVGGILEKLQITRTMCIPFFGAFGVFPDAGGASFLGQFSGSLATGLIMLVIALVIKQYSSFVNDMMDRLVGESAGVDYGKDKAGNPISSPGSFISNRMGINAIEDFISDKARAGIKSLTGFSIKTDAEIKQEKEDKQKDQPNKDEESKRQGLGMLSQTKLGQGLQKLGINIEDKSKQHIQKALQVGDQRSIDTLRGTDPTAKNEVANQLGAQLFTNMDKDKIAAGAFEKGIKKLSSMDANKLTPDSKLKDLHTLLQQASLKADVNALTSTNDDVKNAAKLRIGQAMYNDPKVAESFLDQKARSAVADELLKLARKP